MADAQEPGRLDLKVPPPVIAAASAIFMWGFARAFPGLQFPHPMSVPIAVLLGIAGVLLAGWGIAVFRRARTTINPHKPGDSSALVTSGPYRFTRNPMYTGMLLVLLGWAAFLTSVPALLGLVAFVLYINRFQVGPEERVLQRLFGGQYEEYKGRVRRWL
jgi:protein-S-isoprenylcysteine O-methyltransferase Ste14